MPIAIQRFSASFLVAAMAILVLAEGRSAVVTPSGPLRLGQPVRPVKSDAKVYLVQLKEPPVASYRGQKAGLAATKPERGRLLNRRSAQVEAYVTHLQSGQTQLLRDVGAFEKPIHNYTYALNGFAARLSPEQVSQLYATGQVARIWEDKERTLSTNNSDNFLGLLDPNGGLRADLQLRGEDVVIGIIDSGITPRHPALRDSEDRIPRLCRGSWARETLLGRWLCRRVRKNPPQELMYEAAGDFSGTCQEGEGFGTDACDNKVLGARYYADGFLAQFEMDPGEFMSPRDADGHGTHIATAAAGNTVDADLFGTRVAQIRGLAPRARVAIYKACWLKPGEVRASCTTSDLTRAIDDAVADGVDIINYSIGSSIEFELTAPDDIALLNAFDAGVLSVVAAGNDGPSLATIGSPAGAPWVLTVGASTRAGERFEGALRVNEPTRLSGLYPVVEANFTPPLAERGPINGELWLVDDGTDRLADGTVGDVRDACEALVNEGDIQNRIALIIRGGCEFQDKIRRAEEAGALAVVVYNTSGEPIEMIGDLGFVDIPAVMIGSSDGERLVGELDEGTTVNLDLDKGLFAGRGETGNIMADFSSRGPNIAALDILKPDITAPGVNILAGHTPDVANGTKGELYQYLSGTSMSTPQATAIAALLKEANPDWTPAQIRSAMMTTAYQGVVREDGAAADPLDYGAGHIDPNRSVDPGLVYEASYAEYAAFVCGLDTNPLDDGTCQSLVGGGLSTAPIDLNQPSIGVGRAITGDQVLRRVTNLGPPTTYTATLSAPPGFSVSANPASLSLGQGESATYSLSFQRQGAPIDQWTFGNVTWSDGTRSARSPLALRPVALRAPELVQVAGVSGSTAVAVSFGYSGAYSAQVHGLRAATRFPGFVDDDVTNTFSFRSGEGVVFQEVTVGPDQLLIRFSLFDGLTDGNDDLDLYLFYCPNDLCTQVAQSGRFNSDEEINLFFPLPGKYAAFVHGFETDQVNGGPGSNFELLFWSLGINDDVGNLQVTAPTSATEGNTSAIDGSWSGLDSREFYLGGISHNSATGLEALTVFRVNSP